MVAGIPKPHSVNFARLDNVNGKSEAYQINTNALWEISKTLIFEKTLKLQVSMTGLSVKFGRQ